MRQLPGREVWIGHAGDLRDFTKVMSLGVEAVVDVADSEPPAVLPRELIHLRIPLADGGDNPLWRLQLAINTIATLLAARTPLLVCCSAGMSRSVLLVTAGISRCENRCFTEVLAEVAAQGPVDLSPAFFAQVEALVHS